MADLSRASFTAFRSAQALSLAGSGGRLAGLPSRLAPARVHARSLHVARTDLQSIPKPYLVR